jgi:hypothetical protein
MQDTDITIMSVYPPKGFNRPHKPIGRLYYYQGNFFYPLNVDTATMGTIYRAIRVFIKDHRDMVRHDRSDPAYVPYDKLELNDVRSSSS